MRGGIAVSRLAAARDSSRHGFLHHLDQLLEGERLGEEVELRRVGQALVEGILRITRHEDDLDVGLALLELLISVGPSISGMTTSETTRSISPPCFSSSCSSCSASTPLPASITV